MIGMQVAVQRIGAALTGSRIFLFISSQISNVLPECLYHLETTIT